MTDETSAPAEGAEPDPAPESGDEAGAVTRRRLVVGLGLGAVLVAVVVLRDRVLEQGTNDGDTLQTGVTEFGGTLGCRRAPDFVARLGFPQRSAFSTGEFVEGLVLLDVDAPDHTHQDPSWSEHGYLGPFTYDSEGNLYVAPMARTGLLENPPEEQNSIFKVDTASGLMSTFVTLDDRAPASTQNPFGILELTYDCDTQSLYASSVAGSTRHDEVGQIVRIDPKSGGVVARFADVDAIGLGVFAGARGTRLYFGSARRPEVWSVGLDGHGDFQGPARLEFKLPGPRYKAGEIRFEAGPVMAVVGAPFEFTLVPNEASASYFYSYRPGTDSWVPEGTQ